MNRLLVLLRRELQEHRVTFIFLPLILTGFLIAIMLSGLTFSGAHTGGSYSVQMQGESGASSAREEEFIVVQPFSGEAMKRLAAMEPEKREMLLNRAFVGMAAPLLVTLWIVALVYLLGTLYNERKDRSILFWKSMPVSDAMTIVSKLISVMLILPAIYFACIVVVHTSALAVSSISAWRQGVDVWGTLWAPSHVVGRWGEFAAWLPLASIWYLPMYAWLLLVSSWAKSAPAAWAALVPFVLVVTERMLTPFHWISGWLAQYSWPLGFRDKRMLDAAGSLHLMLNPEMVVSLLIAAAMLYGAIYMRGRTDEI